MNVFFPSGKSAAGGLLALFALVCAPVDEVSADIVEKSVISGSGKSATGFVFQGSRNMKRRGKSRSTASSMVVPPLDLSVLTYGTAQGPAVTAPQSSYDPTSAAKPRFGYGSDYQSGGANVPVVSTPQFGPVIQPTTATSNSPRFLPVVSNREFYPVIRQQNFSPFGFGGFGGLNGFHSYHVPCYTPFSWGIPQVRISYRGGRTSTSAWGSFFGTRIFRQGF